MSNSLEKNPLVKAAKDRHSTIPFDQVKPEHYLPALNWAIEKARLRYEEIKGIPAPTFENVIEAMEDADAELDLVTSVFFNLSSVMSNDEMKKIEGEFSEKLTQYSNDISLDENLFAQIKKVFDQKDNLNLDEQQAKLLRDSYKGFVRSGALLDEKQKKRLREINESLSKLSVEFRQNIMKADEEYEYWVDDVSKLKGMPQDNINIAKEAAKEAGQPDKYLLNMDISQVIAVLDYADNRDLREDIWRAFRNRGLHDQYDNRPVILQTMKLRHERAEMLGYEHHAEFVLEERMAKNVATVNKMLTEMKDASFEMAKQDHSELEEFAKKQGFTETMKPWDVGYFVEKLQKDKYGFDEQAFKPYFEFDKVLQGAFDVAEKLYDLDFQLNEDYPTYHDDVNAYDVYDKKSGEKIAVLVADYFARKGKRSGAWMMEYRTQANDDSGRILPVVGMHGNFQKPTKDTPSLLTFNDVETLFHEFGHSLHGMLSDVKYKSQAGTSVKWDFVELPSQVLENWVSEKEVLDLFAAHYQEKDANGDPKKIPAELIAQKEKAKNFRSGSATLRQTRLGALDMAWHTTHPSNITDVRLFEKMITESFDVMPSEGALTSPAFSHIFAGGYSAGYYSYKWAEILDADAFEAFKEKGLFDKETADKFKEILKSGSSIDPEVLYRTFRGRDADPKALLKRGGLLKKDAANSNKPAAGKKKKFKGPKR